MFERCLNTTLVRRTMELGGRVNRGCPSAWPRQGYKDILDSLQAKMSLPLVEYRGQGINVLCPEQRMLGARASYIDSRLLFDFVVGKARPPPKTHVRATCFSRGPHGEWGNNSSAFDLGHHPSFQACHSYQENRGPDGILRFSAPACCHRRQIAVWRSKPCRAGIPSVFALQD